MKLGSKKNEGSSVIRQKRVVQYFNSSLLPSHNLVIKPPTSLKNSNCLINMRYIQFEFTTCIRTKFRISHLTPQAIQVLEALRLPFAFD